MPEVPVVQVARGSQPPLPTAQDEPATSVCAPPSVPAAPAAPSLTPESLFVEPESTAGGVVLPPQEAKTTARQHKDIRAARMGPPGIGHDVVGRPIPPGSQQHTPPVEIDHGSAIHVCQWKPPRYWCFS